MSRFSFVVAFGFIYLLAAKLAADPARFWISSSATTPTGPAAPTVFRTSGSVGTLHIWAQPATTNAGAWHESANPFKTLQNLSLNLTTDQPVVDFLNDGILVHNPDLNESAKRYQFVFDSSEGLASTQTESAVMLGSPDQIFDLQGFSIDLGASYVGFGPTCLASDTSCAMTPVGPVWLVSSVDYKVIAESGTANFFLQIGSNGMNHAGETSAQTAVVFGAKLSGSEPEYNASSHRGETLVGDEPDFVLTITGAQPGDYNGDGRVNAGDFSLWRDTLGSTTNLAANGNGDSSVDAGDYAVWRSNYGAGSASGGELAAIGIPEPKSLLLAIVLASWLFIGRRAGA